MATVTITSPDGSTRTEDGKGNVIRRTSAPSSTNSSKKKKQQGYATKEEAREAAGGGGVKKMSHGWVPVKTSPAQGTSKPELKHKPTVAHALPEGAREISGGRIKYKGAIYGRDTFHSMQSKGRQMGVYASDQKEEAEYQYIKGQVREEYYHVEETSYPARTDTAGGVYIPLEYYEGDKYVEGATPKGTEEAFLIEGPDIYTPLPGAGLVEGTLIKEAKEAGRSVKRKDNQLHISRAIWAPPPSSPVKGMDTLQHEGQFEEGAVYAPVESFFGEGSQGMGLSPSGFPIRSPALKDVFVAKGTGVQSPYIAVVPPSKVVTNLKTGAQEKYWNIPISIGSNMGLAELYGKAPELYASQRARLEKKFDKNKGITFEEMNPFEYEVRKIHEGPTMDMLGFTYLEKRGKSFEQEVLYGGIGDVSNPASFILGASVGGGVRSVASIPMFMGGIAAVGVGAVRSKGEGVVESVQKMDVNVRRAGFEWGRGIGIAIRGGEYGTAAAMVGMPIAVTAGSAIVAGGLMYGAGMGLQKVGGKIRGFKETIGGIEYGLTSPGDDVLVQSFKGGKKAYYHVRGVGDVSLSAGKLKGVKYGGDVMAYTLEGQKGGMAYQASFSVIGDKPPVNIPYGSMVGKPRLHSFTVWEKSKMVKSDFSFIGKEMHVATAKGSSFGGAIQGDRWVISDTKGLDQAIRSRKYVETFVSPSPSIMPSGAQRAIRADLLDDMMGGKISGASKAHGLQRTFSYDKGGTIIGYVDDPVGVLSAGTAKGKGVESFFGYSYGKEGALPFRGVGLKAKEASGYLGPVMREERFSTMAKRTFGNFGKMITETKTKTKTISPFMPGSTISASKMSVVSVPQPKLISFQLSTPTHLMKGYDVKDYDGAFAYSAAAPKARSHTGTISLLGTVSHPKQKAKQMGLELFQIERISPISGVKPSTKAVSSQLAGVAIFPSAGAGIGGAQTTKQSPLQMASLITMPMPITKTKAIQFTPTNLFGKGSGGFAETLPPLIPLPFLPTGFIGSGQTRRRGGGKTKKQKKRYKPSFIGLGFAPGMPGVSIGKAPKMVTGFGIRGVVEPKKKKKKRGKKK